jgi:sialate O-acetylesterase
MKYPSAFIISGLLAAVTSTAAVQLASPFGEHMILQQGKPVPVWGTADAGETVTVEFAARKKSSKAASDGKWRVDLDPLVVSAEGRLLTVTGDKTAAPLVLGDVLVGEVWICSGQSNMERQLGPRPPQKPIVNWEREVATANYPQIRQLYVTQKIAPTPQSTVEAKWTVCSPDTAADFTAVGYFFARDLHLARKVPIGIIHSSWGGTPSEAWTSRTGLSDFPEFNDNLSQLARAAADPAGAQSEYLSRLENWYKQNDPGSGKDSWAAVNLDTRNWETMKLPGYWENAGHAGFDGTVWLRKTFDLADSWAGRDLDLRLSAIDDVDTTWVNGVKVGFTSGYNTPRTYRIPASLLKEKGNIIAVRVLDTGGNGGIGDTKLPFAVGPSSGAKSSMTLDGEWIVRFSTPLASDYRLRPPTDATQGPGAPTVLYNAMIAPLVPYAIRGVTFYQGEANASRAHQYRTLFPALITDWRKQWGQGDFPFLFVQIAPFKEMAPEIREAQLITWQSTKNTAMAVTIDCGDAEDIHPAYKQPVGARLALAARAIAYGESLEYSGPVFIELSNSGNHAVLSFSHLDGGLVAQGGALGGFTVAGSDGVFHPAHAEIGGDKITVSAPDVRKPLAVRYGWADIAAGNLFNGAGLPASPFRTDVAP